MLFGDRVCSVHDGRKWPKCDLPIRSGQVRLSGRSCHLLAGSRPPHLTHLRHWPINFAAMHKAVFSCDDVAEFNHSTLGALMRRRDFIKLIGGAAASPLSGLRAGHAQPAAKAYRVGILETNSPLTNAANFDALRKGMLELGYIEGQTLFFEYRSADGRNERFSNSQPISFDTRST